MQPDSMYFLETLFGGIQQGFLTLSAIHHNGQRPTPSRHVSVFDQYAIRRALADLMVANNRGWHATVSIGLRRQPLDRWRRGGKADVSQLPALFADLDDRPDVVLPRLKRFEPPASMVVSSGHGIHSYWLLTEPTRNLGKADRVLAGLARKLKGDRVTVASAMRLPGTLNHKAKPVMCRMLECYPVRRYALDDFAAYIRPPQLTRLPPRPLATSLNRHDQIEAITATLMRDYGGKWQRNGWLAAYCPCGHAHDRPGQHFGFHPVSGVGHCFGRHGTLSVHQLAQILNIAVARPLPGSAAFPLSPPFGSVLHAPGSYRSINTPNRSSP